VTHCVHFPCVNYCIQVHCKLFVTIVEYTVKIETFLRLCSLSEVAMEEREEASKDLSMSGVSILDSGKHHSNIHKSLLAGKNSNLQIAQLVLFHISFFVSLNRAAIFFCSDNHCSGICGSIRLLCESWSVILFY
jgi:hypothetical protein